MAKSNTGKNARKETEEKICSERNRTSSVSGAPECLFRFEGPMAIDKTQEKRFYRIYNLAERCITGQPGILKAGQAGGYCEHPELIDTHSNVWIYQKAIVTGMTKIRGNVSIRDAKVSSCILDGNISIGQEQQYQASNVYNKTTRRKPMAVVKNSELISGEGQILVADSAHVIDSKIYGDTAIIENAKLRSCEVHDGYILGFAWLTDCTITEGSAQGQCSAHGCTLTRVDLDGNAAVEKTIISDTRISGEKHVSHGNIENGFEFVNLVDLV